MPHPNDSIDFDQRDQIEPLVVLGSTGLKQSGGYIDEEFLARLRGLQGIRYYREMIDNSPIIAAALNVIEMLIRQVEWRVEPADESDAAKVEAEETEGALEDMSHTFEDFISEVLSMIWAGFAPFEIVYKIRKGDTDDPTTRSQFNDGKWGWRKFEIRAQDTLQRWEFDDEGGLLGWHQMDQSAVGKGVVFIPMEKALLFRTKVFKNNPEGKSLIRPAVIPYHYLKRIQQFEATGVERDLTGMPIMQVPPELLLSDASAEHTATRQYLERFVTQVRMDERWGGLVPAETDSDGKSTGFKFGLMTTGGRRMIDTNGIVKRYETRILMLFLAQFLVMGMDKVGSLALSSNMTDLFGTSLGTLMDIIASVFNRFAIRRRQELNGKPVELDPFMVHGDIEGPDLDLVAKYVQALAASGNLTPHKPLERKLLEMANLPQPPEDEDAIPLIAGDPSAPAGEGGGGLPAPGNAIGAQHVSIVLQITSALKSGQLDRPAAIELVAAALGIEAADAERFLPEDTPEEPPPPPPQAPTPPELPEPDNAGDGDPPDDEGDGDEGVPPGGEGDDDDDGDPPEGEGDDSPGGDSDSGDDDDDDEDDDEDGEDA